ncbi:MAG TPA: hypothetical protein DFS52_17325 [Myxococcales bacterium]|jgi:hypothetical protein|nr:hypothetical protein [Myxococcales bacterium]
MDDVSIIVPPQPEKDAARALECWVRQNPDWRIGDREIVLDVFWTADGRALHRYRLVDPLSPPPARGHGEVDLSLIEANLRRTPEERVRNHQRALALARAFKQAGEQARERDRADPSTDRDEG